MSRRSSACCASTGRAPRGVAAGAHSSAMGASSALRSPAHLPIPLHAAARDGQDPRDALAVRPGTCHPPERNRHDRVTPAAYPGIGVDEIGDAADATGNPRFLRLENLDTDVPPPAVARAV